MSITIHELAASRSFSLTPKNADITIEYCVLGTDSETDVYNTLAAATSSLAFGLVRQSISASPAGGEVWFGSVKYGTAEGRDNVSIPSAAGGSGDPPPASPAAYDQLTSEVSINISGVTQHITHSKETISKTHATTSPPTTPPDYQGAINASAEGVGGCDVETGTMEFSITRVFPFITMAYCRLLRDVIGTTNLTTWWTFPAGEVKFKGATFSPRQNGDQPGGFTGTFTFDSNKNQTSIAITPTLTVPAKKGWEYLWVAYKIGSSNGRPIQEPFAAYVERVFDEFEFSNLGIG